MRGRICQIDYVLYKYTTFTFSHTLTPEELNMTFFKGLPSVNNG